METSFDTQRTQHLDREIPIHEGKMTKATEAVTARVPSMVYLDLAIGAMVTSAALQLMGKRELSLFVGQWAPAILIMGLYNKLVKVAGSEAPQH